MAKKEGWARYVNGTKWHYFNAGRSLCGRRMFPGKLQRDNGKPSPKDCALCAKAMAWQRWSI